MKLFHCFQLKYHLTTDDQVDPGSPDRHALKANVNGMLRLEGYGSVRQRDTHRGVIYRFQEPGTQLLVNRERSPDHFT